MKRTISATIDDDLYAWVDQQLLDRAKYRNKSHIIEIALSKLRSERRR